LASRALDPRDGEKPAPLSPRERVWAMVRSSMASTIATSDRGKGSRRPTAWWLAMLRRRAERMYEEKLDLAEPIRFADEVERDAAVRFFNAAYRAEESGLTQAHALADELEAHDPDLAECMRLYGNEEGWHRELLTEFIAHIGGEIRPMGRVTGTFYR